MNEPDEQLDILELWPCPACHGTGLRGLVPEDTARCRVCEGAGTVNYDPADISIPFGGALRE